MTDFYFGTHPVGKKFPTWRYVKDGQLVYYNTRHSTWRTLRPKELLKLAASKYQALIDYYKKNKKARVSLEEILDDNCPLCFKYIKDRGTCNSCPVMKFSGQSGCKNTPWEKVYDLYWRNSGEKLNDVEREQLINALTDEKEFLLSLIK